MRLQNLPLLARKVLLGLGMACSLMSATGVSAETKSASGPVTVLLTSSQSQPQQLQLNYPGPVRLEQILADSLANLPQLPVSPAENNQPVYWTGAGIFTAFPHPEKARVLSKIKQLAQQSGGEDREVFTRLAATIAPLAIGKRIFAPLDYNLVRINKPDNPLVKHNLILVLPSRPNDVLILGAVQKPQLLSWQPRLKAGDYLSQAVPAKMADNSFATVIQPDGQLEQHPIAYWNQDHKDIAPGAIVYLGFASLLTDYKSFNDDIIHLLRNRAL